jgi:hypothetical protein
VSSPKFDAALSALVSQAAMLPAAPLIEVSVRTREPVSPDQAAELSTMGVAAASARRSIFPARISLDALRNIAEKPWVLRVSLAQKLRPLADAAQSR